jgi:carboxyl-terminal processing protease
MQKPHAKIRLSTVRKLALLVALLLITGNIGYRLGQQNTSVAISPGKQLIINSSPPPSREVDFSLFWDVWNRLEQKYLDKSKLVSQKMVDGAISGMVNALGDPYTVYLPPKENGDFKQELNGSFEGIGAQLGAKDEKIVVITPLKDHPAEKAGIKAGDWILKVNDEDTLGWSVPEAVNKIRGPKGSAVKLQILHDGDKTPIDISVLRDKIIVKSVELERKHAQNCTTNCAEVAYLKLSRFGDQTNDEWNQVVSALKQQINSAAGPKGLVLDVRNNPGGYLQGAIYIASEFIKSGVVVAQENSDTSKETYSVMRLGGLLDIPMTVLINKGSASAAEILAGALKDHKRATIIGETSFGKGTVQTPEDLPGGAGIHITTARWILPNGDWIHGKGIKPDIEVKNATDSADTQLERAIQQLLP